MLDAATLHAIPSHQQGSRPAFAQDAAPCGSRGDWACCYTHPQAERWALSRLIAQGFDAYLPLVTVLRRDRATRSIRHRVQVPAFPRYLFVCIRSVLWAPIKHTRGIATMLLKSDGYPQTVTEASISALRGAEALAATQPPQDPRYWAPGMPCSLRKGYAFEGLPGVVLAVANDTALVSLMFLGHLREISVNLDSLEPREDF